MRELVKEGNIELKTPYVIESLIGEDQISGVELKNFETKEIEEIHCDELLFLFGLNKKLGPISEWGIDMNNKKIRIDTPLGKTTEGHVEISWDEAFLAIADKIRELKPSPDEVLGLIDVIFFNKQKTSYNIVLWLDFRRLLL